MSVSVEPVSIEFINGSVKCSTDSCQENDQYAYLRQHIVMQMQSRTEEETHKRRRLSSMSDCTDSKVDDTSLCEDLENWLKRTSFEVAPISGDGANQDGGTIQQSHDENLPLFQGHVSDVPSSGESHAKLQPLGSSDKQKFLEDALISYQHKDLSAEIEPKPLGGMERRQFLEDVLSSYKQKLMKRPSLPVATATPDIYAQKIKKQRCYSATYPMALSHYPRRLLSRFTNSMEKSIKSEQDIFEWDRKMGLRQNHCRTMGKTRKSRRMLKAIQKDVELGINQHSAKGA
mmetsp:Transcript_18916/g.26031  ORF Transcript_18916/g.26031 Transcript_18916/m.26031 type:complete len:288 (-) Transcript_18916:127-990(-)|eukprot:CAMPEP_0185738962 /NCGR_PEP_ID=MMETSP1171-20130828/34258_1 /TAXON_ID=374046 /ORGANISM="Helicotheca tamensis, Strain CCMP826" /LENGTH=287 /DNA_ID=CAMNT_0028410363 /DNA_START=90 /DNA_END=953 /DNA_ORIENTATION=-